MFLLYELNLERVKDVVTAGKGFGRDRNNLFPTTTEASARFLASASERWQLRGSKLA